MAEVSLRVLPNPDALARFAAEHLIAAAQRAIAERGIFTIGLAGGSTPRRLYELLAGDDYSSRLDWPSIEVFFGDERAVPPEHPDSNFRMADEALLAHVPLRPEHIHRIPSERDPEQAAADYGRLLKARFGDGGLDLCLLGMGEDGHTAGLFPHTPALDEPHHRCVARYVEKLQAWRITMTPPFLNRSAEVLVLISGTAKAATVREVLEEPPDPRRFPIQLIHPRGPLLFLLDPPAAGM